MFGCKCGVTKSKYHERSLSVAIQMLCMQMFIMVFYDSCVMVVLCMHVGDLIRRCFVCLFVSYGIHMGFGMIMPEVLL